MPLAGARGYRHRFVPFLTVVLIGVFFVQAVDLSAQRRFRPPPDYLQIGRPDQDYGRRQMEEFRMMGVAGDYYLDFTLRHLPRRGEAREFHGSMWGTRTVTGPLTRVELEKAPGAPDVRRLLLQNGSRVASWMVGDDERIVALCAADRINRDIAFGILTVFDLQMPFLYWEDFEYEGLTRHRGRPTHVFLMYPPEGEEIPGLSGVRVYLDGQFNALVQAGIIDTEGELIRTINLLDLKKVGDQWLVKTVDVRDEITRDKVRFQVNAAALNQVWEDPLFAPVDLVKTAPIPPDEALVTLE